MHFVFYFSFFLFCKAHQQMKFVLQRSLLLRFFLVMLMNFDLRVVGCNVQGRGFFIHVFFLIFRFLFFSFDSASFFLSIFRSIFSLYPSNVFLLCLRLFCLFFFYPPPTFPPYLLPCSFSLLIFLSFSFSYFFLFTRFLFS